MNQRHRTDGPLDDLFAALFDDASVFPPGNAPLAQAIAEHDSHLRSWYSRMVGPLVLPSSVAGDIAQNRSGESTPLGLSLTGRADDAELEERVEDAARDPMLDLRSVEIAIPVKGDDIVFGDRVRALHTLAAGLPGPVVVYVEPVPVTPNCLDFLAEARLPDVRVKLRTGGMERDAFPTEEQLAERISGCVRRGLAFKCTAGLHHALRHSAGETDFEHHGFLNVLLAVHAALQGGGLPVVVEELSRRDADAIVGSVNALDAGAASLIRRHFTSFGTCSVTEPVEDLVALGLCAAPDAEALRR